MAKTCKMRKESVGTDIRNNNENSEGESQKQNLARGLYKKDVKVEGPDPSMRVRVE